MKRLYTLAMVVFCSCSAPSSAPVDQPIQYNHNLHVQQEQIECTECHVYVTKYARATIPNIEICVDCHSGEPNSDNPEEAKLIEFVDSGTRIPWRKVYRVDDHVYFSHRRHTVAGQIECSVCHGNVEEMTRPFTQPTVPLSMERCIKCHKEHDVSTDCVACHR